MLDLCPGDDPDLRAEPLTRWNCPRPLTPWSRTSSWSWNIARVSARPVRGGLPRSRV